MSKSNHPLSTPPESFPVVVRQTIGTVTLANVGRDPFVVAMEVISNWHSDNYMDTPNEGREYQFPGYNEGETVTVTISHAFEVGTPKVAREP